MDSLSDNRTIDSILRGALAEDLSDEGDITSSAIFGPADTAEAVVRSKATGVLAGGYLLDPLFHHIDPELRVDVKRGDGSRLEPGDEIARLEGAIRSILAGERVALNLLQRLSGIATETAALVALVAGTGCRILDTRKTTPGLRLLEKKAVVAGGGHNHRFGLYDMILIKDTHVKAAGSVAEAVRRAKAARGAAGTPLIEAEVRSVDEFCAALDEEPDRIMLDNMDCSSMAECVRILRECRKPVETEASGNVSAKTIREIAETGVDYVSVGALTHSVRALDIHLLVL